MPSVNTEVPTEETPAEVCEYCKRPFATTDRLVLHKGLEHVRVLTEREKEAFIAARSDEEDDLRTFRLKALLLLVIVYFSFLIIYGILS